ncbi:MAG: PEP-CTERM sorting domain-containing protein [Oxalobacteraceae bacterium]|nr:MAG: PEP-CTERM sorting domain-containing protein [Oxalobacteraceae bacterium]
MHIHRTCLLAACFLTGASAVHAAMVTDLVVFSSNAEGNNWNGLLWNTQGHDTDPVDHYKLYVSTDPLSSTTPTFLNHGNDAGTRITLPLATGTQTYALYGEGVGGSFDPAQHFVLNLFFNGVQTAPGLSAVQNLANTALSAAGNGNGLDIFGNSGQQEAGTLTAMVDNYLVTLNEFSWITDGNRDVVWDTWANDQPYANGSGRLDYFGSFSLSVQELPEPATLPLLTLAGLCLALTYRKRPAR